MKQQLNHHSQVRKSNIQQFNTTLPRKESLFSAHLDLVNNQTELVKASRATSSSDYEHVFEKYGKNISLIDRIKDTFDNGKVTDLFKEASNFTSSDAYRTLPFRINANIRQINNFFNPQPLLLPEQLPQILTKQEYAQILSKLSIKNNQKYEVQQIKIVQPLKQQQIKLCDIKSETVATRYQQQSKIDLLLNEINYQKKRKDDCRFYVNAMEIKLNQFIDYVLDDDDRYLGLSLKDKTDQIINNMHQYTGKYLQGCLVIVLIEYFFKELKQLQSFKLMKLRALHQLQEKRQVHSQMSIKSQRSLKSSKISKYSEPHKKGKQIGQDEWIGRLQ